MNISFQKVRSHVGGVNGILLIIYAFVICLSSVLARDVISPTYILTAVIVIGVACFLICPFIMRFLEKIKITSSAAEKEYSGRKKLCTGLAFYFITLICFLIFYFIYYPGCFDVDHLDQYTQAITNKYSDWHPALHTLVFYKLPLTLTGGWIGSIVLFQILLLSAVFSYSFCVIRKYAGIKLTVICMAFVLMNPQLQVLALCPYKDMAFMMCTVLLLTYGLQIYLSRGEWVKRPINTIAIVIVIVCATLVRHNAVLFTVPFALAVALCIPKKRVVIIAIGAIVLFAGIKFPLYSMLNVEKPDQRQIEMLGLPMTVIGTVVTENPDALDEDIKEFAYRVAPEEIWEKRFVDGSYNFVKWNEKTDNSVIEEYGAKKVISMMFRCFRSSPRQALRGLIKLTEGVYSITDSHCDPLIPFIRSNDNGIAHVGNGRFKEWCLGYFFCMYETLGYVFSYLGIMHLLLIASILAKCRLNRLEDWKRILFILPVLAYNFGTALLLTGENDIQRFFTYTFQVIPLLLLFIYHHKNERNTDISVTEVV